MLHSVSPLQIRMHENGNMDASGSKGKDELPSDWTWERFKVVDGGNGQWALWNPIHNRYMRLHSDGNMDGSGHKGPRHCPPSGLDGKEGSIIFSACSKRIFVLPYTPRLHRNS